MAETFGLLGCMTCLLTLVFFQSRVCIKKSTQERLALKILIDRPKARNEVRGNTVMVVINPCCFLSVAVSIYLVLSACLFSVFINSCFSFHVSPPPALLSVCTGFFVYNIVFSLLIVCLAASLCHYVLIERLTK